MSATIRSSRCGGAKDDAHPPRDFFQQIVIAHSRALVPHQEPYYSSDQSSSPHKPTGSPCSRLKGGPALAADAFESAPSPRPVSQSGAVPTRRLRRGNRMRHFLPKNLRISAQPAPTIYAASMMPSRVPISVTTGHSHHGAQKSRTCAFDRRMKFVSNPRRTRSNVTAAQRRSTLVTASVIRRFKVYRIQLCVPGSIVCRPRLTSRS